MVTYEITARVEMHLRSRYETYMRGRHIPDVLETGFFEEATFSRSQDVYRVRYEAISVEALSEYLENDAGRLRADFTVHFPTGVEVTRENWEVLQTFTYSRGSL